MSFLFTLVCATGFPPCSKPTDVHQPSATVTGVGKLLANIGNIYRISPYLYLQPALMKPQSPDLCILVPVLPACAPWGKVRAMSIRPWSQTLWGHCITMTVAVD